MFDWLLFASFAFLLCNALKNKITKCVFFEELREEKFVKKIKLFSNCSSDIYYYTKLYNYTIL